MVCFSTCFIEFRVVARARPRQLNRYVASSMNTRRFWIPFVIFFGLTPVMLFIGLMSAGAGHGDYFLAKILFPYTLISTAMSDGIEPPFIWLAGFQYPIYGVVMGLANVRRKLIIAGGALSVLHAIAVVGAFAFANEYFSGKR